MQEIKTSIQCQTRGILNPHMGLKISWLILYVVFLQRDLGAQPEMFLLLLQEDCMLEILWFSGPVEVRSRENCASASKNSVTTKIAVLLFFEVVLQFLGGLSLHLNHLIGSCMTNYDWPFGTFPFGLFGSNLDTTDLETYPRTYSGHFWNMSIFDDSRAVWVLFRKWVVSENQSFLDEGAIVTPLSV